MEKRRCILAIQNTGWENKTMATTMQKVRKKKLVNYSKWGYFFIAPFFIIYTIFSLIPLLSTFYYSFFEYYRIGLDGLVGPNWVGFDNYVAVITGSDFFGFAGNTFIMWIMGFVPQITVSLLLALWFTSTRLKLKAQPFFKTVIYMPNLIMASAFAMLFFTLFADSGPVNILLTQFGIISEPFRFLTNPWATRGLVAFMNFLMWFGNTTILLMAGVMGIDQSLIEAAQIDGAKSSKVFTKIILPLLMPILIFVLITSMIGGIQMFDVPQILTNGHGTPDRTAMTLVMFLNRHLISKNFGMAGAVSVLMFFITVGLGMIVFSITIRDYKKEKPVSTKKKNSKGEVRK